MAIVMLGCLIALAGCGDERSRDGGRVTVLTQDDVDSLDPGVTNYQFGYMVNLAMQRTLFAYRPGTRGPVPDLAAAPAAVSADARTIRVRLRNGVRFGPPVSREVTAADVKYAFERGFRPSVANPYARTYFGKLIGLRDFLRGHDDDINGIEVPNARTLIFRFSDPVGGVALKAMALPLSAPVPPEYARRLDRRRVSVYGQQPVATGPFMLERRGGRVTGYTPSHRIVLVRNPNWSSASDFRRPHVDRIEIREGFSPGLASRRILAGRSAVSGDFLVPPSVLAGHAKDERIGVAPNGGVAYVALNTRRPPFNNVAVRRALAARLDRHAMRLAFGGETAGAIATHFLPPGLPGFAEAGGYAGPDLDFVQYPRGNRRLAARYLRSDPSSQHTRLPKLIIVSSNDPATAGVAVIVQRALHHLGLRTRLRLMATDAVAKYCGVVPTEVAVCADAGWLAEFDDPQTILDAPFNGEAISATGNPNLSLFDDREINAKIADARILVDPAQRSRAWAEIDRMVTAAAPAIPWLWSNSVSLRSGNVIARINPGTSRWDLATIALSSR